MSSKPFPIHPGQYVREFIIPPDVTVKDAARILGVGRPALSNFLNGKAALSPEMAMRLEKSFVDVNRQELVELQAAYDRHKGRALEKDVAVKTYVPSLLTIKARHLEDWAANNSEARSHLPILMRKLIHSTTQELRLLDFPAYDNAQRKGWDGYVEAGAATPWTPAGRSGWELSCNGKPEAKAEKDFAARVASLPPAEREEITFIFVTPHNWEAKGAWAKHKEAERAWKAVRAYDASDLEQWLEQSIQGQIWFGEHIAQPAKGCRTLDECWRIWSLASAPQLSPEIFAPAIKSYAPTFKNWLDSPPSRPFIVAADSREEGLAFLSCLIKDKQLMLGSRRDLPVVFDAPEPLKALSAASSTFIPIVHAPETERELAPIFRRHHCIVVRPRNAVDSDPEISLDLLRHEDFLKALSAMEIEGDQAERLAKESARSPTILRRRLSPIDAIRVPHWAAKDEIARSLIPMAFVGAWHTESKADRDIISLLANCPDEDVEANITRMHQLDDCPVWSVGSYRGVASKIDALFGISKSVTASDLNNFFLAAEWVLSERDPKLDLPEDQRWAAGMYGKLRDHSAALRAGICESLVILAVHGNHLFPNRLGGDIEQRVSVLVRKLLDPFTVEKLLSHNRDLPNYAEAAPEMFLRLIEEDLEKPAPIVFDLLKPVDSSIFGASPPRTGLLWALENLAWNPKRLQRVVLVLARLSTKKIDDNWVNKPENSLSSILCASMPQTAAPVEDRIRTLEMLARRSPAIGWKICVEQFAAGSRIGSYNHRPTWRNDASGAGQPVKVGEYRQFALKAIDIALAWPEHNHNTLGDLIERLHVLQTVDEIYSPMVWNLVDRWTDETRDENGKAALRERIRRFAFTRRSIGRDLKPATTDRARAAYERLKPENPVVRHRWLFANTWVQESLDEIEEETFDYRKRDERIQKERLAALREIWSTGGFDGLTDLLAASEASRIAGYLMGDIVTENKDQALFAQSCLRAATGEHKPKMEECLRGFLLKIGPDRIEKLVAAIGKTVDETALLAFYLCGPVSTATWRLLAKRSDSFRRNYWSNLMFPWGNWSEEEANEIVDRLLEVKRPIAAFHAVHMDWQKVETSRLKRLLTSIPTTSGESPPPFKMSQYDLSNALQALQKRAGVTPDEMAHLEFMFIPALDDTKHGIPNLEKQIAKSPSLYVQTVAMTFRRTDGKEDPPEWRIDDPDRKSTVATATHRLLDRLRRTPGTGDDGEININDLKAWLSQVREGCKEHGRGVICDQMIGQLLANGPKDTDGSPCRPICEALEWMASAEVARGFIVAVHNERGAHWRGEGGAQERDLAALHRGRSGRLAFEFPYVASVLERIAASYDSEAEWHDSDAKVKKRLLY